ncbi:MAG: hypothetical protein Q8S00_17465 [Deltaproteobacteria bacterium]|nr:hypothetical protein [Deltaproteobacteria bacterium]MDZ4344164.1 hypothetical protein [Candidatus Binatia bacterium]
MQVKYYIPGLLANLKVEAAIDILSSGQYKSLICQCPYCGGRTDESLRRVAKEHFLYQRSQDMKSINGVTEGKRLPAFLERTERALQLSSEIRRKLGVEIPNQHFKTWLEVFPEVAKRI